MMIIRERRNGLRNNDTFILAVIYTFGFLGIAFLVVIRGVTSENAAVVQQIISIMSIIQAGIVGYFYRLNDSQKKMADVMPPAVAPAVSSDLAGEPSKGT